MRIENGSLKIFEDTISGLKVKEAEEGKLKIYKRREKQSEAITAEKGVSVNRPLDVPVSEVEIDKLKAEMCNLKDRIDKMEELRESRSYESSRRVIEEDKIPS